MQRKSEKDKDIKLTVCENYKINIGKLMQNCEGKQA
jgi:hypothetical protein